ncbi:MAG: hexose kinase [Chlamydiota bacterium]
MSQAAPFRPDHPGRDGNIRVLCVAVTPCLQRILRVGRLEIGRVNRAHSAVLTVGGKAVNAARALAALGGAPCLTGFSGGVNGDRMRKILRRMGIAHEFVRSRGETRICTTLFDESRGGVTEIVEEGPVPAGGELQSLHRKFAVLLPRCGMAIAAGALPPGCPVDAYALLARDAAARGVPFLIDAHGPALLAALPHRPLLAKLNRDELQRTVRHPVAPGARMSAALRGLVSRGARWVLVTDGSRPAFLAGESGAWRFIPPAVKALNSVGSGDSCTAGIAHALSRGRPMPEAVRFGMACGAANAMTLEPGDISPAAALRLLRKTRLSPVP